MSVPDAQWVVVAEHGHLDDASFPQQLARQDGCLAVPVGAVDMEEVVASGISYEMACQSS